MIRYLIVAVISGYLGAGLSLGLVMAQVLPLTSVGVGVYAASWPYHVYCATEGAHCFAMKDIFPVWLGRLMFDLEATP